MGNRKGRALKKNTPKLDIEPKDIVNAPHSFVLHRGIPCPYVSLLTKDFRRIMEPFTAAALKERKNNKIKDFVSISGVFHVSHMCIFQKAKSQLSFKIARLPRGPTLSFKAHQFTLAKDVISSARRQFVDEESFHHSPLVILNNFTGEGKHLKLMANTFQNMFPTINLATVQLSTMKRCVLISYNPIAECVDIRHYSITVAPIGLSRGVKKVVLGKIPNMATCEDIADFIMGETGADSEFEDDEANQVVLPQTLKSRGNIEDNKSAIKLHEIGPRITLELVKIEDGLFTGEVLYHRQIIKSEEETAAILAAREQKRKLKEARRREQAKNSQVKAKQKDEQKQKSLAGMKRKANADGTNDEEANVPKHVDEQQSDDDDAAYYKEEVGEEPDMEFFSKSTFRPKVLKYKNAKRRKLDNEQSEKKDKKRHSDRPASFKGKDGKSKKPISGKKFKKRR